MSVGHEILVDPCQLLDNLNDFVHSGFTLHAAAVIDLELNHMKQRAVICETKLASASYGVNKQAHGRPKTDLLH